MKDNALPVLMFMIMKRNGSIKTRGCANGSSHKLDTKKNEVSSPTPDFYAFRGCPNKKVRKKSSYFRTSPGDLRQKV